MNLDNPNRERPLKFTMEEQCWQAFSAEVVKCAINDYRQSTWQGRLVIEKFFFSEFFHCISTIDPKWLVKNLKEMYPIRPEFIRGIKP